MQTKQKKIYAAVLGLAVTAFAADRWVIGHDAAPEEAEQLLMTSNTTTAAAPVSTTAALVTGQPVMAAGAVAPVAAAPNTSTLARRLREVATAERLDLAEVSDAFRVSPVWLPPPAPKVEAPKVARDLVAEFHKDHRLDAVMKNGTKGGGLAIIDGKTVRPGQALDGFRLLKVNDRSALFVGKGLQGEDLRLELRIERGPENESDALARS